MARRNRRKFYDSNRVIKIKTMRNVLIALMIFIFLFAVYRFNFTSKSEVTETVKINFKEIGSELLIGDQELDVEVKKDESGDKYIVLPEKINGYYSESYKITETTINDSEDVENPEPIASTLASVTNDNIGDYINLGNNVIGTESTTDDWRILYKDGDTVYAILADYLPASQVPASAGLNTNTTTYPYSVYSSADRETLLNRLINETAWTTFTNGIDGALATGSPTPELLINSYNAKNGTELVYTKFPKLNSSTEDYNLYVPHSDVLDECRGYWLTSLYADDVDEEQVWIVSNNGQVGAIAHNNNYYSARPVVAIPTNTQAAVVNGAWTVTSAINPGATENTLAKVTNDNIGEYLNLGNNFVGTESKTDDWRILYKDGETVYAILADYLPASQVPASAGLDTKTTEYSYGVCSYKDRETLLNGLKNEAAWSTFTNGISGATATGAPTAELLLNSYNTKNGTELDYKTGARLDSSREDYDLYVPHAEGVDNCNGYWLASSSNIYGYVYFMRYNGYVYDGTSASLGYAARPVVALPTNTKAEFVDGAWVVGEIVTEEITLQPGAQHYVDVDEDGNIVLDNITVEVTYQSIVSNGTTLYKQDIEFRDDTTKITATGFIPFGYTIAATESDIEVLKATIEEYEDLQGVDLLWGYNIGIIKDDTQYQPKDYGQSIKIKILTTKANELRTKTNLKVLHFTDSGIEQFSEIEKTPNSVTFTTESFSDFAIIVDSEFTESRITFNKYEEDYNYYMGKNYTDPLAKGTASSVDQITPTYTDDNLATVTVNYYGTPYETYENSGTATKTKRNLLGTFSEQTATLDPSTYISSIASNSTDYTLTVRANISMKKEDYDRLDKTKSWSATYTIDMPTAGYYISDVNPTQNTFTSYTVEGNTITVTDSDFSMWTGNCLTINFIVTGASNYSVPAIDNIRKSNQSATITAFMEDYVETTLDYNYVTSFTNQDSGYVSDTERQNLFTYINCLPIENGQVTIELIDNPYMDRPWETTRYYDQDGNLVDELTERNGMGFDGWASKAGLIPTLNANTKVQYLTVPVDENNEVTIDLYAHWKKANVVFMQYYAPWDGSSANRPTGDWNTVITTLNANKKNAVNASSRELNIIVIQGKSFVDFETVTKSNGAVATNVLKGASVGYTVTSLYNNYDYRQDGAKLTIPDKAISVQNDLQIDFVQIRNLNTKTYGSIESNNLTGSRIVGYGYNVRLGRGLTPIIDSTETRTTLSTFQGGGTNNKEYRCVVESGLYQSLFLETSGVGSSTLNVNATGILGCDYDNYTNNNANLQVNYRTSAKGGAGTVAKPIDATKPTILIVVKSGTHGMYSYKNSRDTATGLYCGGSRTNTTDFGNEVTIIEGGDIGQIYAGGGGVTRNTDLKIYVYVKGKKVSAQQIFAGLGSNRTSSDRIIQVTDGTIQYSICGGSNGYVSSSGTTDASLDSSIFVYVGGDAIVGGNNRVTRIYPGTSIDKTTDTVYGIKYGCVLGAGAGSASVAASGRVNSTHVIINDNAKIANHVYGGGHNGYAQNGTNQAVTIDVLGGNIGGNVYSGSNLKGIEGDVTLNINGGTIEGTVYGGSNTIGTIEGNSTVNITGGTINGNTDGNEAVFGGGYGYQTGISGSVNVNITDTKSNVNINGNVYGGSQNGSISGITNLNINDTSNSNEISITGKIFGGGKGTSSYAATNTGDININIDGGSYDQVYGGANLNSLITGNITLKIAENLATHINQVYGGGYETIVTSGNTTQEYVYNDKIYLYDKANITNAYAGGNNAGIAGDFISELYAIGAKVTNMYGGSNASGELEKTNVFVKENAIVANVYGAGFGPSTNVTGDTNVTIENSTVTNGVFGGGNEGTVDGNTNINTSGATIQTLYGAGLGENSIIGKTAGKAIINLKDTTVTGNVYGGGFEGQIGSDADGNSTEIILDNATAQNVYGGGQGLAATTTGKIKVTLNNNSTVNESIYGGGDKAVVNGGTEVNINTATVNQNVYAGGNGSDEIVEGEEILPGSISGTTIANINSGAVINQSVYGAGRGLTATVNGNTDVNINEGATVNQNIYGGGDNGSVAGDTSVIVSSAKIGEVADLTRGNVYGAGKGLNASLVGDSNVVIENISSSNGNVNNVYGGGELGNVDGSTNVRVTSSEITNNVYGAGKGELGEYDKIQDLFKTNGLYALVNGDATVAIEGNSVIGGHVFGGGDAANIGVTGTSTSNNTYMENCDAKVYISGGTVRGNVYGGANRSKVWGDTEIYIGKKAIEAGYIQAPVYIVGTIFGGGEAVNDLGVFTYDFLSVHGDIDIDIDGTDYDGDTNSIDFNGSIFGSGNASSAAYNGDITITNYGETHDPKKAISIQRAGKVLLDNSSMRLFGATDSTNEYADSNYTFNIVQELKIKNNSYLYLRYGANLLASFYSMIDVNGEEVPARVHINDDSREVTTKNVDNRIYMYSGQNLNIANSEDVLGNYGVVEGMTFFGLYTEDSEGNIYTGIYDRNYEDGKAPTWTERDFSRSYILGLHQANHNTTENGFYTVFEELTEDAVKENMKNNLNESNYDSICSYTAYIEPTPPGDDYFMWYAGPNISTYNYTFALLLSKYSTLSTKELNLVGLSYPNASLTLRSFGISNWKEGVGFYDKNTIKNVEPDQEKANNNLALTMKTGNTGWNSNSTTNFYIDPDKTYEATNAFVENDNYTGDLTYLVENSEVAPTLSFYLYHSNNIEATDTDFLGSYKLTMDLLYMDGQDRGMSEITIDLSLRVMDSSDEGYNGSISPGVRYEMFSTVVTDISNKSSFSTFLEYAEPDFKSNEKHELINRLYENSYRVLNTGYELPENTTITMIDRSIEGEGQYYYYNVKKRYDEQGNEIHSSEYNLSEFKSIGTMGQNAKSYNEKEMNLRYYNEDLDFQYESFIFIINFENAEFSEAEKAMLKITQDPIVTIEMRAYDDQADKVVTLASMIDYQLSNGATKYNIYNSESDIEVTAKIDNPKLYVGQSTLFTLNTNYETTEAIIDGSVVKVHDSQFFDKKLGANIILKQFEGYDENGGIIAGEEIDASSLIGTYFEINGEKYYPKATGSTSIKIADKVSNVLSRVTINAEKSILATGDYVVEIESFGSADGEFFGNDASDQTQIVINVINDTYGLSCSIPDYQTIVDKTSGNTLDQEGFVSENSSKSKDLNVTLNYASSVENPYITVSLERREYGRRDSFTDAEVYNTEYSGEDINLADYVVRLNGEDGHMEFTEDEVIKTINKTQDAMTDEELKRFERIEYEALDTETLRDASTVVDMVAKFNLDYRIIPKEEGLKTGTYRLIYTLYDVADGQYTYIGETYTYIIIK